MYKLKDTICFKLMVIRDKIHDYSKKEFQEIGITYGNYVTLLLIYENPGITQAQLAEANRKDRNVISQTLDKLENKNLVERVRGAVDRRSFTLYLTKNGEDIIKKYWDIALGGEQELFKKLSKEEQTSFCAILDKLLG